MSEDKNAALRYLTKGAGIVFIGTILQLGLAFFGKIIIARFLEVSQYGQVTLGILVVNVTITIVLLGLDEGITRYVPRFDTDTDREGVVFSAYEIALPLSLLGAGLVYLFAGEISTLIFSDPSLRPVLEVMSLIVPFWVLLKLGIGTTRGLGKVVPRVLSHNIVLPGSRLLLVVVVSLIGLGVKGIAIAYVLSYGLAGLFVSYIVLRNVRLRYDSARPRIRRKLLSYSAPLSISSTSGFITSNIDLLFLGVLFPSAQVGIYNVAYPVARILTTVPGMFGFLFTPLASKLHAADDMDDLARIYQVLTKWMTLASLPAFTMMLLFPEMIIKILFGSKYIEGALTLSVLSLGFFGTVIFGLNGNALKSFGRSQFVMYTSTAIAGVNVVLNLILIPTYGVLGAGIATSVAYLLNDSVQSLALYHYHDMQPFNRSLFYPILITTVLTGGFYLFITTFVHVTLQILVVFFFLFLATYGIAILRFGGIDQEDVMMLNAIEKRGGIDLSPLKTWLRKLGGI